MRIFIFIMSLTLGHQSFAQVDPTVELYDSLLEAMGARSLTPQSTRSEDDESDSNSTCIWGGWISSLDDDGRCQPAFRLDVYNDPAIRSLGPTYDATMRCGANGVYRCNPVIFGKGEGSDSRGYCVEIPEADSAMLMTACRQASESKQKEHLTQMRTNPELLANFIAQVSEISLQCRQGGSSCSRLVTALSDQIRPAVACHDNESLFSHLPMPLEGDNLSMIDELTGSLASSYNSYMESLLQNRDRALAHNRALVEQAIAQYSQSDDVRRMWARLEQNFTVHYNRQRRRIGSKSRGRSVGRCLMYTKLGLVSGGFFRNYPPVGAARDFGPQLRSQGFVNLMEMEGFEDMRPEDAPPGAVVVYTGGEYGHIEVKMEDGGFGSDFHSRNPISAYNPGRRPTGIYVKIPRNIEGLVEVPNE